LNAVDWYTQLGSLSAEDGWRVFRDKFELEHKFIPEKILSMKKKKPLWMTHTAHKVVSRKRQIYRKYKNTTHPAVIEAFKAARREVKKAKRQFELNLANNIKVDRKSFFAYVRSKSKSNVNVSSIADSQGELTSDSKAKAEMLNDFFSSVFTKELVTDMPVLGNLCDAKLVDISVTVDNIKSKLQKLKSASEMTYIVSSGALNSTHLLTHPRS